MGSRRVPMERARAGVILRPRPSIQTVRLVVVVQAFETEERRAGAQLFFDTEELVVLCDAVGAAHRAGLDLAHAGGDSEVGDESILGFAGAVGHNGGVAVAA